jgi:hypothetical protein
MAINRALDRDSATVDSDHHLAAISSFARNRSHAPLPLDIGTEFQRGAETLVPVLRDFLNGSREQEALIQIREHLPAVRDALRQIVGDLEDAHVRGLPRDKGIDSMNWLLVGIHMEGILFALLPERWEAMHLGAGDWGERAVLRNNIYWTHEGLQRADVLCDAWREALMFRYGGA